MVPDSIHDFEAITLLICVTIIFFIDVGAELSHRLLKLKWSVLWLTARYVGIICAILLALNALAN